MSLTVKEVAYHLAAITQTEEDILLIGTWIDARWKELAAANNLRVLLREGELYIPASIRNVGTVSVTQGSTAVTGVDTAFTNDDVGKHIRIKVVWYKIVSVVSATSLVLETPYTEPTLTGTGYAIVQRQHKLAADVRKLGVFFHMRLRRPLNMAHKQGLDLAIPSRHSLTSVPTWVVEVEASVDGIKQVEIYPFSQQPETIHYAYWAKPFDLNIDSILPDFIDIEAFREGVMVDILRHKMHKAMEDGKMEAAALWRNEYRAQETRWNSVYRTRVLGQEQGSDDQEFILSREGAHPRHTGERIINDAFSEIWWGR